MRGRGFTVVEVLVALVIISSAMIPMLGSFTGNIRATGEGDARSRAISLLEGRMTDMKLSSYEGLERSFFTAAGRGGSDYGPGGFEAREAVEFKNGEILSDPLAPAGNKRLDLSTVFEKGVRYGFDLKASRFRPSYEYRGLDPESTRYTGPSRITGKRCFILCELKVSWKTRKGFEHTIDAVLLKAPTS